MMMNDPLFDMQCVGYCLTERDEIMCKTDVFGCQLLVLLNVVQI